MSIEIDPEWLKMLDMETLGERLNRLRAERALSQEELARRAGVTKAAVSAIEKGVSGDPKGRTLIGLARALGVDPVYLSEGKGESPAITPWNELSEVTKLMAMAAHHHLTEEQQREILKDIEDRKRANEEIIEWAGRRSRKEVPRG